MLITGEELAELLPGSTEADPVEVTKVEVAMGRVMVEVMTVLMTDVGQPWASTVLLVTPPGSVAVSVAHEVIVIVLVVSQR